MRVYTLPASLYGFKLRLALRFKGLTIDEAPPPGGTYRSEAFRRINPAGTIPLLVDGEFWLAESDAIVEYLDDLDRGASLRPLDPRAAARARMLSRWHDMQLEPAVRRLFPLVAPAARDAAALAEIDAAIGGKLALIEQGLDAHGPFAAGAAPSLADCGLASTATWLEALARPMSLAARPGARLVRLLAAVRAHPAAQDECALYRGVVEEWVRARIRSPA
jgi:glutathione S-transferase